MPPTVFSQKDQQQLQELASVAQDVHAQEQAELDPKALAEKQSYGRLFDFTQAKPRLTRLVSKWNAEITETFTRRLIRNIELNVKKLRDSGAIKEDETIVPVRLVDTNIEREKPAYINYLNASNRLSIFKCQAEPTLDCQALEAEWTNGMRYDEWNIPHFRVLDGAQLHGWDAVEVVYDESKPFHVGIEHIGHENFYFALDSLDNQFCEIQVRRYSVSMLQLKDFKDKFSFDPQQVDLCLQSKATPDNQDDNIHIFKCFYKYQDVVYTGWYEEKLTNDWLKKPAKLFLGVKVKVTETLPAQVTMTPMGPQMGQPQTIEKWVDADIKMVPVFILPYTETEQQTITSHKGRCFYDQYLQEAMTAITTGFTNSVVRSSNVYASVGADDPTSSSSAAPRQLDTPLVNGALYDRKLEFFATPSPNPAVLNALQYLDTKNAADQGDVAFAVNNRQDSRKTAEEIKTANSQQAMLSTVQVVLYSVFLRKVYSFAWLIAQSQALQGKVSLLKTVTKQELNFQTQQYETKLVNDDEKISKVYQLFPAGDTDVIEKEQMINNMRMDWPVISQTPLANEFLKAFLEKRYPQYAQKWSAIIDQQIDLKTLLQQVMQFAMQLIDPVKAQALAQNPQAQQQMQQLMQQVQQALAPSTQLSTAPKQLTQ